MLIVLSGVCAVVLVALVKTHTSEPVNQGRSLSKWIAYYITHTSGMSGGLDGLPPLIGKPETECTETREAAEAIRHIGPDALPWLVEWISFQPKPWRARLLILTGKLPAYFQTRRPVTWLTPDPGYARMDFALSGFAILGPTAAPAIPQLTMVATNARLPGWRRAVRALIEIGPPAVPALTNLLSSNLPSSAKVGIAQGLARMGSGAAPALPTLVEGLNDPDSNVAAQCAITLSKITNQPEMAIPELTRALDDPRPDVKVAAAAALGEFGSAAQSAVAKLQVLRTADGNVGEAARKALTAISAETAVNAEGDSRKSPN